MHLKDASILLVDDEPVLLDIMAEWFKSFAGQVFCAPDGAQALQILGAHKIDLVITDVRMPVMDGVTLLKRLKARGSTTPSLIFVTGFADIEARDAYDLGAEALLEKPIERDDLVNVVRHSLAGPAERWSNPPNPSALPRFSRSFSSLAVASEEHEITFGRGGFCVGGNTSAMEGPVNLELNFKEDGYVLSGQGVVRWVANRENQTGIELTHVAQPSRPRALELTQDATAFIPRSTGGRRLALAG
jgi:CheY-like chemotaxis protein